jgi:hypothetical protein
LTFLSAESGRQKTAVSVQRSEVGSHPGGISQWNIPMEYPNGIAKIKSIPWDKEKN